MFKYRFEDGSVRDLEGKDEAYIAAFIKRHPTAVLIEEDVETEVKGKAKGPAAMEVAVGPQLETQKELTNEEILFPGSESPSVDPSSESLEIDIPTEGELLEDGMLEDVVITSPSRSQKIATGMGENVFASDEIFTEALNIQIDNNGGLNFNQITGGNLDNLDAFATNHPDELIVVQEEGIEGAGNYRDSLDNVKGLYFAFSKMNDRAMGKTGSGLSLVEVDEMNRIEKEYLSAREVHEDRFKTLKDNVEFISREDLSNRRAEDIANKVKDDRVINEGSKKAAIDTAVAQANIYG